MHLHLIEDENGDLVDVEEFCSDWCHREHVGEAYRGWHGCNESEFNTVCQNCEKIILGVNECWGNE